MMRIFRVNKPKVFFYLLLAAIILKGTLFLAPPQPPHYPHSLVANYLDRDLLNQYIPLWMGRIAIVLLFYLQAIFLNLILIAHGIVERNSYVPALIYLILTSLFMQWLLSGMEIIAFSFLLIAIYNLFSLNRQEVAREPIFYTALYLSLGSLFYFPIALLLLVILGVLIFRRYSFFDIFLTLTGFVLPYFFIGIGFYYLNDFSGYWQSLQTTYYSQPLLALNIHWSHIALIIYMLLLAVGGFLIIRMGSDFQLLKVRRPIYTLLAFLIILIVATPFVSDNRLTYLEILAIPAAVFISKIFDSNKIGLLRSILLFLLIVAAGCFQLYFLGIL